MFIRFDVFTISSLFALQFQIACRRASVNKYRRKICREIRNARHVYIGDGGAINVRRGADERARGERRRKILSEFYCPDVADSARFQAPLKNPTWLNFWSNYFELNKHPACGAGPAAPLLALRKGRTATLLAREFHAFVRSTTRLGTISNVWQISLSRSHDCTIAVNLS